MSIKFKEYNDTIDQVENMVKRLKKTPLNKNSLGVPYSEDELFQLLMYASEVGVSPYQALCGGLYIFNGKIEMTSRLMQILIRSKGHSIEIQESTKEKCTLYGKRVDNWNELTVSFSKSNIKNPKVLNKPNWRDHSESMLFARALSLLARRLFADVIGGAYVEGELEDAMTEENKVGNINKEFLDEHKSVAQTITPEQVTVFEELLKKLPEYVPHVEEYLKQNNIKDYASIPLKTYERFVLKMTTYLQKKQQTKESNSPDIKLYAHQHEEVVNG